MKELEKYEEIYLNPAKYKNYGHSNHGSRSLRLLDQLVPKSIVDIGCGFNEFITSVKDRYDGVRAVEVDFAPAFVTAMI